MTLTQTSKNFTHTQPRPKRFEAYISNRTPKHQIIQNTKINMYFYLNRTKTPQMSKNIDFPIILDFCATFSQNPQNPTVFLETFYIY